MFTATRHQIILQWIKDRGNASVAELQKKLSVSEMTIRRDLDALQRQGFLRRVHGGAVPAGGDATRETSFLDRTVVNADAKRALARYAAAQLRPGESLFLDGGTTCCELVGLLPEGARLTVFTNSLEAASRLRSRPGVTVVSFGGELAADGNTFDGLLAVEAAEKIKVDACFVSCFGFDENGVFNEGLMGTAIKKIMLRKARRRYLLADADKYGAAGLVQLCSWTDVDVLVCDDRLPAEARGRLRDAGIRAEFVAAGGAA